MSAKQLDTNLNELIQRYGYDRVHANLIRFKPHHDRSMLVGNSGGIDTKPRTPTAQRSKKSPPKKKPKAVTTVKALDLGDDSKRQLLMEMAEKFERREFLPHVAEVRMLLDNLSGETHKLKSKTQAIPKIFRALSALSVKELHQISNHDAYAGRSSSLETIAAAIARAGQRARAQYSSGDFQKTR